MNQVQQSTTFTHSFYAIKGADGKFFAGYNSQENQAAKSETAHHAKWFSNRFDIRLRPNETIVEIKVDPSIGVVSVSEPFRPKKRIKPEFAKAK